MKEKMGIFKPKITIVELFGGIGSPREALEQLLPGQIDSLSYVEFWNPAVEAYNKLFNHSEKPRDVWDFRMDVDILVHGSPCQDFSSAGIQDLKLDNPKAWRSMLYLQSLEIIRQLNPKVVIWENVKGLLQKKNRTHFEYYLNQMEVMGYTNHYQLLNSLDFGIPQSRSRIFTVSIRNDQTMFNRNFNFDELERTPYLPLANFLDKEVDEKYYITQKSMIKAIEAGKIKILNTEDDLITTETITTKQMRWNNAGVMKVPLIEVKESLDFTNFVTLPRQSDGEVVNGNYNRYWKNNKYVGTIASSTSTKIAIPVEKNIIVEVNKNYDYRLSDGTKRPIGEVNKEGKITIPLTTNHMANKIGVSVAPTLTTGGYAKIITPVNKPLLGIPIFIIDDKPYHLRVLTPRETWRLMGWSDEKFNLVQDLPSTHLYKMGGNAIVIQVLEAIFKELFKGNEELING